MHLNHIVFSAGQIESRVAELAETIKDDYSQEDNFLVLCVMNGSFVFCADLVRKLGLRPRIEFVRVSSYTGQQRGLSSIESQILEEIVHPQDSVLVVEDIVDTGQTALSLMTAVKAITPQARMVSFLDKPSARTVEFTPDYTGFRVENRWVVGYGMDLDGFWRNLPAIWYLK